MIHQRSIVLIRQLARIEQPPTLEELKHYYIRSMIERTGNITEASQLLQVDRRNLHRVIKKAPPQDNACVNTTKPRARCWPGPSS